MTVPDKSEAIVVEPLRSPPTTVRRRELPAAERIADRLRCEHVDRGDVEAVSLRNGAPLR
jgi:hypothetical protein